MRHAQTCRHYRLSAYNRGRVSESIEAAPLTSSRPAAAAPVFPRLLRMLRPHWGAIALAVVFLLMSLPAELFPGLTWMYVTDELILRQPTRATAILHRLF